MNANEYFEFICKKPIKKQEVQQIERNLHGSIGSLIISETKNNLSQGIQEKKERILPMSVFLQPIV